MQLARQVTSLSLHAAMHLVIEAWAASVVVALATEDVVAVAVAVDPEVSAEATMAKTPARMREVKRILAVVLAVLALLEN